VNKDEFVSGSYDYTIKLLSSLKAKACVATLRGHFKTVYSLCKMCEDLFISGTSDKLINYGHSKVKLALLRSKDTLAL